MLVKLVYMLCTCMHVYFIPYMCIHVYTCKVQPYVYDKDSIKFWYKQPLNKMIYLPSRNHVLAKSVKLTIVNLLLSL